MKKLKDLIEKAKSDEDLKRKTGVYKLHWKKGSKPESIHRLAETDNQGILYIGCTKKQGLYSRLKNMATAFDSKKKQMHTLGLRLVHKPLKNMISIEDIYVTYELCDNSEEREKELIRNYFLKYGEEPPLNSKTLEYLKSKNNPQNSKP